MVHLIASTDTCLLMIDTIKKTSKIIESDRPAYYGISWFTQEPELVLSHDTNTSPMESIQDYALSEVGYLSKGKTTTKPFLSAPHQILCAGDSSVICTNTGRNCISIIDLTNPSAVRQIRFGDHHNWDRFNEGVLVGEHINSLFLKDSVLYVVSHNFNQGSLLRKYSFPEMFHLSCERLDGFNCVHNFFINNEGSRIICNSPKGQIVNLTTKTFWSSSSEIPVFTRGLAASDDYIFVGETHFVARPQRSFVPSGVWVIEHKTFRPLDFIFLGPIGSIRDIRILDVPDLAHNGFVFNGAKAMINDNLTRQELARLASAGNSVKNCDSVEIMWNSIEQCYMDADGWLHNCEGVDVVSYSLETKDMDSIGFHYKCKDKESFVSVTILSPETESKTLMVRNYDGNRCVFAIWAEGVEARCEATFFTGLMATEGKMILNRNENKTTVTLVDGSAADIHMDFLRRENFMIRWSGSIKPVGD